MEICILVKPACYQGCDRSTKLNFMFTDLKIASLINKKEIGLG